MPLENAGAPPFIQASPHREVGVAKAQSPPVWPCHRACRSAARLTSGIDEKKMPACLCVDHRRSSAAALEGLSRFRPHRLHRHLEPQSAQQGLYLLLHVRPIMQDSDDPVEALQIGDNDFGRDGGIEVLR